MRVLVIPEDQHRDQYILKPIIERLFKDLALTAQVEVLPEPRMRGTGDALDRTVISEIVADNAAMTDLFLLVVDRDCDRERNTAKVANIEKDHPNVLLGCLAFQEVEVWMLALYDPADFGASSWKVVRQECDPKEKWAQPFLVKRGGAGPGGGTKHAMRELKTHWKRLTSRCPEIGELQTRIKTWQAARS